MDPNTEAYIIKKYEIQDQNHDILGLIKFKTTLRGEEYRLVKPGGSVLIKIRPKSMFGKSYFLENSLKKIIGLTKDLGSQYILKKNSEKIILRGKKGKYQGRFEIKDERGRFVASFSMLKTGRKIFGSWNDQFVLHIHDMAFDRIILLGFFVFVYYRELSKTRPNWKDAANLGIPVVYNLGSRCNFHNPI